MLTDRKEVKNSYLNPLVFRIEQKQKKKCASLEKNWKMWKASSLILIGGLK